MFLKVQLFSIGIDTFVERFLLLMVLTILAGFIFSIYLGVGLAFPILLTAMLGMRFERKTQEDKTQIGKVVQIPPTKVRKAG